jgi:hypothetical protein
VGCKRFVSEGCRLFSGRLIAFSLDENAAFVRFGFFSGGMNTGAFGSCWVVASSIRMFVRTSDSIGLGPCLLLGPQLLQGFLHYIGLEGTAVGGDGDPQTLEFRDQIPILHPKLFG